MESSILPKTERKNATLLLWYLKSNCFRSFFGRIERHQKDISKLADLQKYVAVSQLYMVHILLETIQGETSLAVRRFLSSSHFSWMWSILDCDTQVTSLHSGAFLKASDTKGALISKYVTFWCLQFPPKRTKTSQPEVSQQ